MHMIMKKELVNIALQVRTINMDIEQLWFDQHRG